MLFPGDKLRFILKEDNFVWCRIARIVRNMQTLKSLTSFRRVKSVILTADRGCANFRNVISLLVSQEI